MENGDKVKYVGCSEEQYRWGHGKDPRPVLIRGKEYVIESVEKHNWSTTIKLKGIEGGFNSVCFERVENGK